MLDDVLGDLVEAASFGQALSQNLLAERFAVDAYRKIPENVNNRDKATMR